MKCLKILAIVVAALAISACGKFDRFSASITGNSETCVDGVKYIQFSSGVSVKYKPDGSIATCK